MIWNGIIRSILIAYVKVFIASSVQARLWGQGYDVSVSNKILAVLIITFNLIFTIWITAKLKRSSRKVMRKQAFQQRYSILTNGLHLSRNSWTKYFYPFFLLKRIIFVCLPFVLHRYPFFQIQIIDLVSTFYIIYYQG